MTCSEADCCCVWLSTSPLVVIPLLAACCDMTVVVLTTTDWFWVEISEVREVTSIFKSAKRLCRSSDEVAFLKSELLLQKYFSIKTRFSKKKIHLSCEKIYLTYSKWSLTLSIVMSPKELRSCRSSPPLTSVVLAAGLSDGSLGDSSPLAKIYAVSHTNTNIYEYVDCRLWVKLKYFLPV